MGIQGLAKLIADCSAAAVKEGEIKNYFGMKYVKLIHAGKTVLKYIF